jgi:hypothetical protein
MARDAVIEQTPAKFEPTFAVARISQIEKVLLGEKFEIRLKQEYLTLERDTWVTILSNVPPGG